MVVLECLSSCFALFIVSKFSDFYGGEYDKTQQRHIQPLGNASCMAKVQSWYMQGDWYDPAEMLAWKADPWRKLSKLANELSAGTYQPDPYPLIPYPKKETRPDTSRWYQLKIKLHLPHILFYWGRFRITHAQYLFWQSLSKA